MIPRIHTCLLFGALASVISFLDTDTKAQTPVKEAEEGSVTMHAGWSASVIASEPEVVDPVAIRLDRMRRMWIVEMSDYPTFKNVGDLPKGRIRVLEDRDGDGHYETATTFADQLLFPTGVQPWRDGAIVTLAGKIVWLQDQDRDGVAEYSEVWFEGFAIENEQLRANHPVLGPDGMIYVAGGLRGGKIRAVHSRFEARAGDVDLRDHDFCFNPDGGDWKAVAGNSQFGLSINDFGRRIGCSNRNPAFTNIVDDDAIAGDQLLSPRDAIKDISKAGESSHVKPRTDAWTTSNLHSGQFSAACGVAAPGWHDNTLGNREWLLVCEPTGNLVQRQWLTNELGFWRAERDSQAEEFLSSTDGWFRPVDMVAGPGQSIYIADMVRAVIEHPHWAPEELKNRPDTWDGNDRGRIWKVTRDGDQVEDPSGAPDVTWLGHSNPWIREIASQYFFESAAGESASAMSDVIANSRSAPTAVARAAQWLAANQGIDPETTQRLLNHEDKHVLVTSIRLVKPEFLLGKQGDRLLNHDDAMVRLAVASRLGSTFTSSPAAARSIVMVARKSNDHSNSVDLLGSVHSNHLADLCRLSVHDEGVSLRLLTHWWTRWSIEDQPASLDALIKNNFDRLDERSIALIDAWSAGNRFRGARSMSAKAIQDAFGQSRREQVRTLAERVALNSGGSDEIRSSSIRVALLLGEMPKSFRKLLDDDQPSVIRKIAINGLFAHNPIEACDWLADRLLTLPPSIRVSSLELLCSNRESTLWLLDRIQSGSFASSILTPQLAKRLTEDKDSTIATRANRLFAVSSDRQALTTRYEHAPRFAGDLQKADVQDGKRVFLQNCSACHRIDGVGTNVGPDISDSRDKTPQSILNSILNPNAAIDAAYFQYTALTVDGRLIDGLLSDDRAEGVTLRRQGGENVFVSRSELERLQASGASLMPNGFERLINEDEMANLIAYLKNWRYHVKR